MDAAQAAGDRGTHLGPALDTILCAWEKPRRKKRTKSAWNLRGAVLGGKYEFVLTTHVDKDHLHNHLIFNAVSFVDYKKYHSNKQSYHFIRRTSDRICKEHGLSVVVPGQDKGKSYIEHQAEQNGTSYKAKLRSAIDRLLPGCTDLEDLLRRLQREGYELKRGKYISAKAPGQERFTRLKTLGADYAEEALTARIAGRPSPSRQPKQRTGKPSLLIDIQNNIKAQQSAGYKHWATIENLKTGGGNAELPDGAWHWKFGGTVRAVRRSGGRHRQSEGGTPGNGEGNGAADPHHEARCHLPPAPPPV